MATEYPLSLIIKAVDKATAPLRAINNQIQNATAPVRKLGNSFRVLAQEAGVARLGQAARGFGSSLKDVGHEAFALTAKVAGLATVGGYALYRLIRGTVDAGDELAEVSQRVGLTADAYAQLRFAAAQSDVEQEAFNAAMDQFNKRLGAAKAGTGELLSFLKKVAPNLANQIVKAKSTEEALALMTGAFEKLSDSGKIAAMSAASFGRNGLQVGQWLHGGTKAIQEQRKRFFELAGSQEEFARKSSDLDNVLRESELAFGGLQKTIAVALYPAITSLAQTITSLISDNKANIKEWANAAGKAIDEWVKNGGIQNLIATMREWVGTIGSVFDMIGGLKGALVILGVYMASGFIGSVLGAVSALWSLGWAAGGIALRGIMLMIPVLWKAVVAMTAFNLTNPIGWIVLLGGALATAAALIWRYWGPVKEFFTGLWEKIKPILEWVSTKMAFTPFGLAAKGALWAGNKVFGNEPAQPAQSAGALQTQAAHVTVDFKDVPKGTRVTADPNSTADLNLNTGYAMAASH